MSDTNTNVLATPWILVIILSVIVSAETVALIVLWRGRRARSEARVERRLRPETEWFELSRSSRRQHHQTGYSPIEPPTSFHRR